MKAKLSTDGGARGNPGPAAYGYVLEADDGTVLDARGETIGVATNNVAEYSGLIAGLAAALERGVDEVEVVSDSELLVKQMRGEYKVKNEALRELVDEAEDGTVLDARGEANGKATNNVAEYRGLLAGLESAIERGVDEVEVVSDSELLVNQMRGEYKVKNETLRELVDEAESLERRLKRVTYTAVRREHNELADRLVNEALDQGS